jgi:ATP-binding cassette subfamily C protein
MVNGMLLLKDLKKIISIAKVASKAFHAYRLQIIALIILGFIGSLLEGVGVNALIPLFSFAVGAEEGGNDLISQFIQRIFLSAHISFNVKYLLIFISILFILKAVILVVFSYISNYITLNYESKTRGNLLGNFLQADWPYLSKQKLGHLETVLMTNVRNSSLILGYISNIVMAATSLIIYTFIAINISAYFTFLTLVLGGFLLLITRPFIGVIHRMSSEVESINKSVSHYVNENIIGLKTIKATNIGSIIDLAGRKYFEKLKDKNIKIGFLISLADSLAQPISLVFICVIFAIWYKTPGFNFAALAAIVYLIKQMFSYFNQLQKQILVVNEIFPYLHVIVNYENEVQKFYEADNGTKKFIFNDKLEFKNVSFGYREGEKNLNQINFRIKRGETTGIIGPSGAGKTTIVDLLLRLLRVQDGSILLDGVNINDIALSEWRSNIGYISQDIFLINDTIANNISFYNESVTKNDIEQAIKMAGADFVNGYQNGLETIVGERGVMLSGGQRQRIVIARVMARKPKILIMDEATSALDNESEIKIQEIIEKLKGKMTVLVIAHRLSTIINSDRLLVIDKGKILEQGNPQELLKDKESYFYKVYNIRK